MRYTRDSKSFWDGRDFGLPPKHLCFYCDKPFYGYVTECECGSKQFFKPERNRSLFVCVNRKVVSNV